MALGDCRFRALRRWSLSCLSPEIEGTEFAPSWHNDGKGFLDEVSDEAGITQATRDVLSFGGGFIDYDNDGLLDIFIANGHVYPEVEQATPGTHYKQLNSLFHNDRGEVCGSKQDQRRRFSDSAPRPWGGLCRL